MLLLAVTACDNADYSKSAPFDNGVYLSVAESKTSETMTFNKTIIQREKSFTARLAYPAGTDVTVNVTVDPSQVEAYNSRNNTSYDILPAKHYRLESNEMTIRAGKINSAPLHIYFENLTELEIDKAYLCPVSLNSAQGVGLLDGSTTYWYIVKRSSAITTAVDLRYCYVEVPGFYVPKWGTEPAGNAAHLNNLKAVTFEIITRISNFDEANTDISSLMGIEQYFCFRAGDAGFPRQQLQIQTPAGKFPEANKAKLLKENEWYHLALTYDIATKTIIFYVNGKEQSRSTNYGNSEFSEIKLANRKQESFPGASDGDWLFYIGRSYNDRWLIDRQLNGNVCEARIWDVARTQQEIWKNMYDIEDPENFESFDFVTDGDVFFDFKHWKWNMQVEESPMRAKVLKKLDAVGGKRAFIVNLFSDGVSSSSCSNDGRLIEVPGILLPTGQVDQSALNYIGGFLL